MKSWCAGRLRIWKIAPAGKEKALLRFVTKVNHRAWEITADDMKALYAVGWTDEAIYNAVTVCAFSISTTAGLTPRAYTPCRTRRIGNSANEPPSMVITQSEESTATSASLTAAITAGAWCWRRASA